METRSISITFQDILNTCQLPLDQALAIIAPFRLTPTYEALRSTPNNKLTDEEYIIFAITRAAEDTQYLDVFRLYCILSKQKETLDSAVYQHLNALCYILIYSTPEIVIEEKDDEDDLDISTFIYYQFHKSYILSELKLNYFYSLVNLRHKHENAFLNFAGIDLHKADLSSCHFHDIDFTGCDFQNAKLTDSIFERCRLQDVDFSNVNFSQTSLFASDWANADLSNVTWSDRYHFVNFIKNFRETHHFAPQLDHLNQQLNLRPRLTDTLLPIFAKNVTTAAKNFNKINTSIETILDRQSLINTAISHDLFKDRSAKYCKWQYATNYVVSFFQAASSTPYLPTTDALTILYELKDQLLNDLQHKPDSFFDSSFPKNNNRASQDKIGEVMRFIDTHDSCYSILQIAQSANEEEIKHAYNRLALSHHPDKNKDIDLSVANHQFQLLTNAKEILLYQRNIHDNYLLSHQLQTQHKLG